MNHKFDSEFPAQKRKHNQPSDSMSGRLKQNKAKQKADVQNKHNDTSC